MNDVFLQNFTGNGTVADPGAMPNDPKYAIILGGVVLLIGVMMWILTFKIDSMLEVVTGLFAGIFTVSAIILLTHAVNYNAEYPARLKAYTEQKAAYDEEQAALKTKAEEMVEVRKTYKIYLNGEEVSYNSVLFSNYDCNIDDNTHTIYLTM
jgi:hypothetical protein